MPWLRISATAARADAEAIAEKLQQAGAVGVSMLPGGDPDDAVLEPAPRHAPLWNTVRVHGLFAPDADLTRLPGIDFDVDFLPDQNWSAAWRTGFGPRRFGRLLIVPNTAACHGAPPAPGRPGDVLVRLDPGLAFGTGAHATTALCLDWLAHQSLLGRRLLDVGSGSGILAIAAGRLGASVVAVDHDPQARRASADNARRNHVELPVESELSHVPGHFDVAIVNIVADSICDLAGDLTRRADMLVLSGILPMQAERVMGAFPEFKFQSPTVNGGWLMLCGQR